MRDGDWVVPGKGHLAGLMTREPELHVRYVMSKRRSAAGMIVHVMIVMNIRRQPNLTRFHSREQAVRQFGLEFKSYKR